MPILNLQRDSALPEIGRIRKGAPKTEQGYVGRSLDYFRFTPHEKEDLELTQRFAHVFGNEPKAISGYLAYATVDSAFVAWNEIYTEKGIQRQCDSKSISLLRQGDGSLANYTEFPPNQRPMCARAQNMQCECSSVGRLFLTIPQLKRWGAVTLVTSSKNDIVHIYQVLHHLQETIQNLNVELNQIPMRISRFNKELSVNKNGQLQKFNVALIRIEPHPDWVGQLYDLLEKPQILSNNTSHQLQSNPPMIEQSLDVENGREFYDDDHGMEHPIEEQSGIPVSAPPYVQNTAPPVQPAPSPAPPVQPAPAVSSQRQTMMDSINTLFELMKYLDTHKTNVKIIQMATKTNAQSLDVCSDSQLDIINQIATYLYNSFKDANVRLQSINRCYDGLTNNKIDSAQFDLYTELVKDSDMDYDQQVQEDDPVPF